MLLELTNTVFVNSTNITTNIETAVLSSWGRRVNSMVFSTLWRSTQSCGGNHPPWFPVETDTVVSNMGVVCDYGYAVRVFCRLLHLKRVWGQHPWYPVFLLKTCKHDNCYQGKLHRFEPYIQPLGTNTWGHCTNVVFLNQETSTTSGLLDVELEWTLPWLWVWQMEVKMSND